MLYFQKCEEQKVKEQKVKEQKVKEQKGQVQCPQCAKSVPPKGLRRHIQDVHEPPQFKCTICDKVFSRNTNLKRHMETKHSSLSPSLQ